MSQSRLAEMLATVGVDVHQTAIARLECGKRAVRFNEATALARVLDLDLRAIADGRSLPAAEELEALRVEGRRLRAEEERIARDLARVQEARAMLLARLDGWWRDRG